MVHEGAQLDTVIDVPGIAAHVRAWLLPGQQPVVLVGELSDGPWADQRTALQRLIPAIQSAVPDTTSTITGWFLYRPWYGTGPDQFAQITVGTSGTVDVGEPGGTAVVEVRLGQPVRRFPAGDYTRSGVRLTRQAVDALAEAHRVVTSSPGMDLNREEVLRAVDDLARLLSRARDLSGALVGAARASAALPSVLAGPLQRALTTAVAESTAALAGSAGAASQSSDESSLTSELVLDADQGHGTPVLGTTHVRTYRPAHDLPVVVFTQLSEPSAAPVLAAAPQVLARVRSLIGLADEEPVRVVAYYPEGSLDTAAAFYLVNESGSVRVDHDQVSVWAGTRVRLIDAASATIARLP
ncbi:hypothetical protein [Frankia sp. AiPs1]|uniref:hypothetical protein n=1 Tax=Frankia sp. AiPs1 TaxID=573493 RepID=UPI00255A8C34|nr:hypothetical protein [Frankia sp. AiPs1]